MPHCHECLPVKLVALEGAVCPECGTDYRSFVAARPHWSDEQEALTPSCIRCDVGGREPATVFCLDCIMALDDLVTRQHHAEELAAVDAEELARIGEPEFEPDFDYAY